jgi:TolB-like protein
VYLNAQPTKVAILDFENTSGKTEYDALGKAMSSMLITDLSNNIHPKKVEIFERSQLNKLLEEQKLQKSKNFDAKTAVDFGKLSGVNYVFVGSVFVMDGNCNITSKLVDVQTSKIILSKEANGKIETWLQLKSQLAEAIAIQLNNPITLDPSYKDQSTTLSTINQYGKIVTTMDQGDVDKAEQMRSLFEETNPDFKYFSEIKDEIERLKQRVSELENVTDILTDNFDLGDKAEMKKDFKSAIKYFEKFINNPGNQGHVENKKLYAYSKLARCQFLTGDYTNAIINSQKAQLIYKFFPEVNETELMSLIKLEKHSEAENKFNFIVDSLTWRNEQNFRLHERNKSLVWQSIDGINFGLLPEFNVNDEDENTWLYYALQNYEYGSPPENEAKIKKILSENTLKLSKLKNKLSQYEKIEKTLLELNEPLIFSSDQILNFYNLSLIYGDELRQKGEHEKYQIHLIKEIKRMERFGVWIPQCSFRVPIGENSELKKTSEEYKRILWELGLENSGEEFTNDFKTIYGKFILKYFILLLEKNKIQDAAYLYQSFLKESVLDKESYFYNYYWDIILGLRTISNSRSPLFYKEFEKKIETMVLQSLKKDKNLISIWSKVKSNEIIINSGKITLDIDFDIWKSIVWSENIGLIEDGLGNTIKLANNENKHIYSRDSIPAFIFKDFDESMPYTNYDKLYNFWALKILIQNPPKGWRVAGIEDYFDVLGITKEYYCEEAAAEYLKKYPNARGLGAQGHYRAVGKDKGLIWNSQACIKAGKVEVEFLITSESTLSNMDLFSNLNIWTADKVKDSTNYNFIQFKNGIGMQIIDGDTKEGYYNIRMVKTN